ncbi:MAG: hemerythrin [Gemmatimonadetes bacterium]|nr:hemerythrin domain-containing protein [Gemmatimonadota bacterium]NNM05465.1 hemerythrin [Gemmatimonadota bacterium]
MPERQTATEGLREEHEWILKVSEALEVILDREPDHGLDFYALEECVSFIRLFADACHHGQEEDLLFPELEARGMPRDSGPLAVMLKEHEMGRSYVGHMLKALPDARGGDPGARQILVNSGRGYIELIRAHILKEDNVLFNFADQLVTGGACDRLCRDYGTVCRGVFEGRSKRDLEALAESLLERYGS